MSFSTILAWIMAMFIDPSQEAAKAAAAVHVAAASLRAEQPKKPETKPARAQTSGAVNAKE